jgi:hypothetical protein
MERIVGMGNAKEKCKNEEIKRRHRGWRTRNKNGKI